MTALLVALGGGLGALLRFTLDGTARARWGALGHWATFGINITGSLVLGVLAGLLAHGELTQTWELALGTGVCGGYTTFSTASVETVRLLQQRRAVAATVYAGASLIVSLAACAAGYALAA
ncbi:CrcB family protein [Tsukamurella sp. 8F]|uniref:fluoride efflux transporter FluC n=1 Tax=unclassified Tsukamurella TaxID=2633480 RepID=UPI0023B900DE|nr:MULTISPECIES: CrcB family protein [unclassified Tsukamurella]MDF0531775.1 CrcB family protein [Tsukamurella sp. 8J]MDF0588023.1 CrcB family protein [Tsukamurella sp. 8F]